jgi:hypothetical protein
MASGSREAVSPAVTVDAGPPSARHLLLRLRAGASNLGNATSIRGSDDAPSAVPRHPIGGW